MIREKPRACRRVIRWPSRGSTYRPLPDKGLRVPHRPIVSTRPAVGTSCQDAFHEALLRFRVSLPIVPEAPYGRPLEVRVGRHFLRVGAQVVPEGEVAAQLFAARGQDVEVVPRRVRRRLEGFAAWDPEVALVPVAGP